MKKICYITTVPGTVESFLLKTIEYLHNNTDWDISVITSYDAEFEKKLPEYVRYFPVNMKRGISISGVRATIKIYKILKKEKFDLVQYSTPNAALYASIAARVTKVPVRLYCQWGMVYVGFEGLKRIIFKMMEKLICANSTTIEPDSKSNLKFAIQEKLYNEKKGYIIGNGSACGINLEKFNFSKKEEYKFNILKELQIPKGAYVYGFVGRITRDKGINELLEATKKIFSKYENCYLILVGNNEIDSTVNEKLYNWSQSEKRVIYCGYREDTERYYSAMDCYILPSYREGFGMGVIEAGAMGVPVIVSDIPGPTDAVIDRETGLIVKKGEVESLFDAMMYMLEHSDNGFGIKGHRFVSTYFEQKALLEKIKIDRESLLINN